jgi:hypothetical protein
MSMTPAAVVRASNGQIVVVLARDHAPGGGNCCGIPDHYSVAHFQREHDPLTRRFAAGRHVGVGDIIVSPRFPEEGQLKRGAFNYQLLINCNHEAATTREASRKAVFASVRTHAEQNCVVGLVLEELVPTTVAQEFTAAFAGFPRTINLIIRGYDVSQNDLNSIAIAGGSI